MGKQPLYPHKTPSQMKEQHGGRNIYCYEPQAMFTTGILFIAADSREEADKEVDQDKERKEYYNLRYKETFEELGEDIKRAGELSTLGEIGF